MTTLGKHQGDGIRFNMYLSAPNGGVAQMLRNPEGQWVSWNDYEKLKAEVERLTERNKFLEQIDSYLQGANENAYEKRCDELEAEVERLRKAGDWMREALEEGPIDYQCRIDRWNTVKEGKPSV